MNFFSWYYSLGIRKLTNLYRSLLIIIWDNFSISLLAKSLFAPWKKDVVAAKSGGLSALFQVVVMNLTSRFFGFLIRSLTIISGLTIIAVTFVVGAVILVIFIAFPATLAFFAYLAISSNLLWLIPALSIVVIIYIFQFNHRVKKPSLPMTLKEAAKSQTDLASYLDYEARLIWEKSQDLNSLRANLATNSKIIFIFTRAGLSAKEILNVEGRLFKISPAQFLSQAAAFAVNFQHPYIEPTDLFMVIFKIDPPLQQLFREIGVSYEDMQNLVIWQTSLWQKMYPQSLLWEPEKINITGGIGRDWASGYSVNLDQFATDISAQSSQLRQQTYYQAHLNAIEEIETILARSGKHNVVLVGDPGIGKEATVLGFADKIARGKSIRGVGHKRVLHLNISAITSGSQNAQEIEQRLILAMNDAVSAGNIILYIPNIERLFGQSEGVGQINAAEVLLPYLSSSQLQLIGTTDFKSYHQFIEPNSSLAASFEKIEVNEPTKEQTLRILQEIAPLIESRNRVIITYQALKEIVKGAERYLGDRRFPQKGIDLMDEVAVSVSRSDRNKLISPEDVDALISQKTEVPVGEVQTQEKGKLLNLENILHQRLINQEEAVKLVADALRRARAGLQKGKKPIGSFLFLGPTGVGKTETAKALAEAYFGDEKNMVRFDMSEYQDVASSSRLIGGVGYETGGLLTNAIREQPFTLLLLDEIEKAHPNILNLFLQVLDEGQLKDSLGQAVDFSNAIIIATSNAGANFIRQFLSQNANNMAGLKEKLLDYVQNQNIFKPEFLNRFDAVVAFRPLTQPELIKVVDILLSRINSNLSEKRIMVTLDQAAKEKLAELGFDPQFGARALARTMQAKVENLVAQKILDGSLTEGQTFNITGEMI